MGTVKNAFHKITARRAMALLAGTALFFFAAGGSFFHQHKDGRGDTPCHVCQSLHVPALAPANAASITIPEFAGWYHSLPVHSAPCAAFSFHHAGRAPPAA